MRLIQPDEQKQLFHKLIQYFEKIHPELEFSRKEQIFNHKDLGNIYYTFPGETEIATEDDIVVKTKKALKNGYSTPLIVLRKGKKDILLDGHRRLRAAWDLGVSWHVLVMIPNKEKKFGIESHIEGQVKDIWSNK